MKLCSLQRQRKAAILAGVFAAFAASSAGWQSTQSSPGEITTREAPISFSSRVNLVSVPVVVRDSKGRAVGGLEKDDFQLLDSGKPQIVSGFSVEKFGSADTTGAPSEIAGESGGVSGAAVASRMPSRFVALVVDDLHTEFADLVWAREAAEKFLASVPPSERIALYTTSGQVGIDFTSDRDQLVKELRAIRSFVRQPTECMRISYFIADRIRKEPCTADEFDGVRCPTKSAMAAEAAQCSAAAAQGTGPTIYAAAQRALAEGDLNTRQAMNTIRAVIGKLATSPGQRQIVLISDGFLVLDEHRETETALFDDAIRAHVTVSSLDARGVKAYVPGGDASQHGVQTADAMRLILQTEMWEADTTAAVMDEAANATGGRFFHGNNDMELGLERLAGVPDYVYVLAFAPQNLKFDGHYHALKVTLRNGKGLAVEARRGYYAPNHELSPAEQAKDEIQAAFFSTEELRDLPASMETEFLKTGAYEATVNVVARVDVKQLRYKQEDGRNRNDVTIVCGLFDEDGNYVTGIQKVLEMRLRDETLADRLASGIAVKSSLKATPGKYIVRMVVRDSEGKELTALTRALEIP
jgi:VWFA-related protein